GAKVSRLDEARQARIQAGDEGGGETPSHRRLRAAGGLGKVFRGRTPRHVNLPRGGMDRQSGCVLRPAAAEIGRLHDRCQTRRQTEYEGRAVKAACRKGRLRSSGGAGEIIRIRISRHVYLYGGGIDGDPGSPVVSDSPGVVRPE